ncbi:MAG: T9SS type A sorting domain-containing protein [Bacteroidota bacterium]|nr:T9SS type A sorting domain-containing protein [Bacteroidota bacterium]
MLESLDINDSVVIKGQDFADGEVPATVQALPKPDGAYGTTQWPGSFFEVYGDAATFRVEDLILNGALADESNAVFSTLTARGDNQMIEMENVVMANFTWNMQSFGNDTSFDINNTVGKDYPSYVNGIFFGGFIWGGGGWMGSFKDFSVTNSSIMNCWCNAIVISTHAEQALVDHVSFVNIVAGAFFHRGTNNLTVRNSLFYNSMLWRHSTRWDAILWGDDIAQGPIGVMNLASQVAADSATIANGRGYDHLNRNITWHNNAWANDSVVRENWDSYPATWSWDGIDSDGNAITLSDTTMYTADEISVWVGQLGQDLMAADPTITEYNNVETTDDLALDDVYTSLMLDRIWDFRDNENHDRYTNLWWKFQADGQPVTVQWPMHEDLSYSMSSPAATASTSGGPVGDPRWSGASGVDTEEGSVLPEAVTLHQNYPNPFNPTTEISFSLADRSAVRLTVYNVLGQVVRTLTNEVMLPGTHSFTWDGKNSMGASVPSGVYLYSLNAGDQVLSKKMTLIK